MTEVPDGPDQVAPPSALLDQAPAPTHHKCLASE